MVRKECNDGIANAVQACLRKAERLQNNDRFVPKPLRFKCSRILSLFCVIYARLVKGLWLFALLLVVIFAKVAYRLLLRNSCPNGQTLACCPLRTPKKCKRFFGFACCQHRTVVLAQCALAAGKKFTLPQTKKSKRLLAFFGGKRWFVRSAATE